ncbi:DUF2752 domain-containing protein [Pontibacter qinzhouensis]|uniref:DUF2752 domain-containing protein n=1 Tax=Pontibacter qinzhouensis TaxID=2603253 RepID=A0A5C8KAL9_9BACT|nr:DUF2752 domain-containing protein [Pontibacter qinzhouensis]TXK46444.1 DUF2752 domain-containing protein [Pontibacter qinzhouensis]
MHQPYTPAPAVVARNRYLPEAAVWVVALVALAFTDPEAKHLVSFCPVSWVYEGGCPGCGLGHAISFLFRGQISASWQAHPLGVPALLVLLWRVYKLLKKYLFLRSFHLSIK